MKQVLTFANCSKSTLINRYVYVLYIVLAIYLFIKGDASWAFTNLGVALLFDPFNASVKWENRPVYQKAWLLIHVAIMIGGFVYLYFQKY